MLNHRPVHLTDASIDPVETASVAALNYATDQAEGILRRKRGKATTLRNRHVTFHTGVTFELSYRGKSGIERCIRVSDRKLARIVRQCHDLPGKRLFTYVDDNGEVRPVTSQDVNDYLRETSGDLPRVVCSPAAVRGLHRESPREIARA